MPYICNICGQSNDSNTKYCILCAEPKSDKWKYISYANVTSRIATENNLQNNDASLSQTDKQQASSSPSKKTRKKKKSMVKGFFAFLFAAVLVSVGFLVIRFDGVDGAMDYLEQLLEVRSTVVETTEKDLVKVTFSEWDNPQYTYIGTTDAAIGTQILVEGGEFTQVGIKVYDENMIKIGEYYHTPTIAGNTRFYFGMITECKIELTPGTLYYYKMFAVINGKNYYSETMSFTTLTD